MNTIENLKFHELVPVLILFTSRHRATFEEALRRDIMTDLNIDEKGYQDFKEQAQHYHQLYLDILNDPDFCCINGVIHQLLFELTYKTDDGIQLYDPDIASKHE